MATPFIYRIAPVLLMAAIIGFGTLVTFDFQDLIRKSPLPTSFVIVMLFVANTFLSKMVISSFLPRVYFLKEMIEEAGEYYIGVEVLGTTRSLCDALLVYDCYAAPIPIKGAKYEKLKLKKSVSERWGDLASVGKKATIFHVKCPEYVDNIISIGQKDSISVSLIFTDALLGFRYTKRLLLHRANIIGAAQSISLPAAKST